MSIQEMEDMASKYGPRSRELTDYIQKYYRELLHDAINYKPKKDYLYMLTFTIDPKKVASLNDIGTQDKIELYISKLLSRCCREVRLVKEHADTNCHWHASIICDKYFDHKNISYYKRVYGLVDVSRTRSNSIEKTLKYMEKENEPTKII